MNKFFKLSYLLSAVLVGGCLIFAGCGDKSGKGQKSSGSSSSSSGESAGSDAIQFHNTLIGFTKLAREPLMKIMQTSKKSVDWVERERVITEKPMWNLVLSGINPYTKVAKFNLGAPKSFSKDDQTFFNDRIASVKKDTGELNELVAMLVQYYKAEDYKDDKHKKSLDAQQRIQVLVRQIAQACGEMGARSEKIASAAERENLKKNPVGIYILNMRDIMEKCEAQMDVLTDERLLRVGSGTNFTDESKAKAAAAVKDLTDKAEAFSKEIAGMAEKFKAVDKSALGKRPQLAKDYENFFKTLDDQQGTVRKNIRRAKEFGYVGNKSDMQLLSGSIKNVVQAHNGFINSLNKGY